MHPGSQNMYSTFYENINIIYFFATGKLFRIGIGNTSCFTRLFSSAIGSKCFHSLGT